MNRDFLIGSAQLNQAFESQDSCGCGAHGSEITRRSFIKRTGGATMATLVAWNLALEQATAVVEGAPTFSQVFVKRVQSSNTIEGDDTSQSSKGEISVFSVDKKSGRRDFEFSTQPYWKYTLAVAINSLPENPKQKVVCETCATSAPVLTLEGLPNNSGSKHCTVYQAPWVGRANTRGVTVAASNPEDPKLTITGPFGSVDASNNNLSVKIEENHAPGEAATNTIHWTVTPSQAIDKEDLEKFIMDEIAKKYQETANEKYDITVKLPDTIELGGVRSRAMTDSAVATNDTVGDGSACCL